MASRGEPGGRPEGVNPSAQGSRQLPAKGNEPESVAFISVKNNKDINIHVDTSEGNVEHIQAAAGSEDL